MSTLNISDPALLQSRCLIGGQWQSSTSGGEIEVLNPADGTTVGTVPSLTAEEVSAAVDLAHAAQTEWARRTAKERGQILHRWFEAIEASAKDLAAIMTAEQGKPLAEAEAEIHYAASFVEWFGEEARRVDGDVIPSPWLNKRLLVLKQPVGVCAAITPWNFPAAMITRKVAPALAAGCTIIVKPASQTPLTALALGALALRAGVPPGVLQIVTGPSSAIGEVLCTSPKINKVSFTGSTEVGRKLMAVCAPSLKRLSLELGGNAPFLVFDDADLDAAVEGAIASKFRNAGQTCVCTNRIYVHDRVYDAFASKLIRAVSALTVGPGTQNVQIGPLIDEQAVEKIEEHLRDAVAKGAQILHGGHRHPLGGLFFEPTVIGNASQDMLVAKEETFGPIAPLIRFHNDDEALAMANDTEFGLAAYFYTRDAARVWRVTEALECGMVGHNTGLLSNEVAPFGGIKQSGFGREGSKYGMAEYLDIKYLCSAIA